MVVLVPMSLRAPLICITVCKDGRIIRETVVLLRVKLEQRTCDSQCTYNGLKLVRIIYYLLKDNVFRAIKFVLSREKVERVTAAVCFLARLKTLSQLVVLHRPSVE